MRPLKAYIDLSALTSNLKLVKKIAKNSKVMAVLKANAYGHGLIESVKAIKSAEGIAILTIEEAVKIRKAGFKNTILLLEGLFAAEDIHQAEKLNLNIVSAGFDPISKLNEVPNNPKQRYEVMTKDMPNGGSLSLDMMYRTCGTQLNLDYSSEEDFVKKFKIINSIVPISIALFANSSIVEKKNSGYMSYRSKVWQDTSRGGLPEVFFDNMDFEKYADFAINFPLLFIQNEKKYLSGKKYSFLDFMNGKIKEIENRMPTEIDLTTHLSTIFTENRLKKYIELRSMDTCGWDCLCAGPAFNTGIIYGNLDETYELISKWDKNKIINAYFEAPKKGFNTELMGKDLYYWSTLLLNLSKKGLKNRDILNSSNQTETKFLTHLENLINKKTTNADHMINKFSKSENLNDLYDK